MSDQYTGKEKSKNKSILKHKEDIKKKGKSTDSRDSEEHFSYGTASHSISSSRQSYGDDWINSKNKSSKSVTTSDDEDDRDEWGFGSDKSDDENEEALVKKDFDSKNKHTSSESETLTTRSTSQTVSRQTTSSLPALVRGAYRDDRMTSSEIHRQKQTKKSYDSDDDEWEFGVEDDTGASHQAATTSIIKSSSFFNPQLSKIFVIAEEAVKHSLSMIKKGMLNLDGDSTEIDEEDPLSYKARSDEMRDHIEGQRKRANDKVEEIYKGSDTQIKNGAFLDYTIKISAETGKGNCHEMCAHVLNYLSTCKDFKGNAGIYQIVDKNGKQKDHVIVIMEVGGEKIVCDPWSVQKTIYPFSQLKQNLYAVHSAIDVDTKPLYTLGNLQKWREMRSLLNLEKDEIKKSVSKNQQGINKSTESTLPIPSLESEVSKKLRISDKDSVSSLGQR